MFCVTTYYGTSNGILELVSVTAIDGGFIVGRPDTILYEYFKRFRKPERSSSEEESSASDPEPLESEVQDPAIK